MRGGRLLFSFLLFSLFFSAFAQEKRQNLIDDANDLSKCFQKFRVRSVESEIASRRFDLVHEEEDICLPSSGFDGALGLGVKAVRFGEKDTFGLAARIRLSYEKDRLIRSKLKWDTSYDVNPSEVDVDRKPLWHEARLNTDVYLTEMDRVRLEWELAAEAKENTVTIENSFLFRTGPRASIDLNDKRDLWFSVSGGWFLQLLEFDDDLPRSLGKGRAELEFDGSGPYCAVELTKFFEPNASIGFDASVYWDLDRQRLRELPIRTVYRQDLSWLAESLCGHYLNLEVGVRFLDDNDLLGDDIEGFASVFFETSFFGGRRH